MTQAMLLDDAALRRVAVLALLIVRPDGLTMRELANALGLVKTYGLSMDINHMTDATAELYQDDCPAGCDAVICPHARLRLLDPGQTGAKLMGLADALGMVFKPPPPRPKGGKSGKLAA